jgi:diacylglycerol kinase family enzyme
MKIGGAASYSFTTSRSRGGSVVVIRRLSAVVRASRRGTELVEISGVCFNLTRSLFTDSHRMRFIAVLNQDGGTFRSTDLDAFAQRMRETLERHGHEVDVRIVAGAEIESALSRAAMSGAEVVMAGGGDGTVSAAATALKDNDKALATLPAGTMNLFARSLGIPLSLDAAVEAFAGGKVWAVDMASANRRPFVHQFSIGMHAKMIDLRESMEFASRLGKLHASLRAAIATMLDPPSLRVSLTVGDTEMLVRTTGIGVTNNLFGEGHLPYADHPDGGVLGIYVTVASARGQLLRFFLNVARGRWRDNPHVEIHESERAVLRLLSKGGRRRCVIDGELSQLARETRFEIHKKALKVLVPANSTASCSGDAETNSRLAEAVPPGRSIASP